ncbi:hypothetical protein K435DRAFT_667877, partial [Dendrothele bispora CBS 962.96]
YVSSTHNTRIERLWVEVGRRFVRRWRAFFYRLEDLHGLQRSNPHHLWITHFLFLDMINQDCLEFQREWNSKPVTGRGGGLSPDVCFHIHYPPDDCVGLTVEETMESYGVHGKVQRRPHGHSGAGYSPEDPIDNLERGSSSGSESEESEWEEAETIHDDKFTAPPVKVPRVVDPFSKVPRLKKVFKKSLLDTQEAGIIPDGYGMHPEEWEHNVYPSYYTIRSGRKGSQELRVELPDLVWRPRSVMWVQALDVYNNLMAQLDMN